MERLALLRSQLIYESLCCRTRRDAAILLLRTFRMRRNLWLGAAVVFFAWENIAIAQWLAAHNSLRGGLAHAWATLQQDGLIQLVWIDMGVFTLASLGWMWRDATAHNLPRPHRAAWLLATVILGCPGLLAYIALRPDYRQTEHPSRLSTRTA